MGSSPTSGMYFLHQPYYLEAVIISRFIIVQLQTCTPGNPELSIVGSLRDREVARSASDRQGSNFEYCVWRTVSCHSTNHPREVLLAHFSLYVHKGGLRPDSFHFKPALQVTQNIILSNQSIFHKTAESHNCPIFRCIITENMFSKTTKKT